MKLSFYLKLYLPALGILLIVVGICLRYEIPIDVFMVDPYDLFQAVPWAGLVSNLGVLGWSAAAGICFFSAVLLSDRQESLKESRLLFAIGLITTLVLLDDFFTLHEIFYPGILRLHEHFVALIYIISLAVCLYVYKDLILRSKYLTLALACSFLGLSIALDILSGYLKLPWHRLYEDGFKFLGIVSWMGYWAQISAEMLNKSSGRQALEPKHPTAKKH